MAGERYRIRRGGFRTRGEAHKALNRLRLPDRSGRRVTTVGQWLTVWSETRLRLRHSTARSYRSIIEHYLLPYLAKVPLAELDYKKVAAMFRSVIKTGGVAGRPLAAATLHRIQATLSAALNAARREGLIATNPARQVRLPRSRRPQARWNWKSGPI